MDIVGQSNFLHALGWAVMNSLWQMALLWVVYQLLAGIGKNGRSSQKSSLATLLLVTGFAWFVYTFLAIFISGTENKGIAATIVQVEGHDPLNNWLQQALPVASIVYLVLLVIPVINFIRNYRYIKIIRRQGLSKAGINWKLFVNKLANHLGIKKPVQIWVSEMVTSPVTIGFLKPVILVPLAAINHLTTEQLEAVLLHELAHIRRHDYFINLIIRFIRAILYFNPFTKAFVMIIEREREKSCDEMVMQFQYDPHGYASALLQLERQYYFPKELEMAAAGKKKDLLRRIEWIMGVERKSYLSFNKFAGLVGGLFCVIALNTVIILSKNSVTRTQAKDSYASINAPLYYFSDRETDMAGPAGMQPPTEPPAPAVMAENATNLKKEDGTVSETTENMVKAPEANPDIINTPHPFATAVAFFNNAELPELKKCQEEQVKTAIESSKKVVQEAQWKEMEKKLAEVFTQSQKEQLKTEYKKEIDKMDWENWERKLNSAYDQVDWDRVNVQLDAALSTIRIDSVAHVYNKALSQLVEVEVQLNNHNIQAIPDTDISIESVNRQKKVIEKAINEIKLLRNRKVVRL